MASLVRYVIIPGDLESLTYPKLVKEIVIDDNVVSTARATFSELEVADRVVGKEFLVQYKNYVSTILENISLSENLREVSFNDLTLIKLATIACLDMIDIPISDLE